jgi:MoxR-like ATPase
MERLGDMLNRAFRGSVAGAARGARAAEGAAPPGEAAAPPQPPASLEAAGLSEPTVVELVLRHLLRGADMTVAELAAALALPTPLVAELLARMRSDRLIEVPGRGSFDADVRYVLTTAGRVRADDAYRRCHYTGPAPVSVDDYVAQVRRQKVSDQRIARERLDAAIGDLALPEGLSRTLGAAMNSQRPIFLYGRSGTGKTYLAEHLVQVLDGGIWVPHAIEVDGEIVQLYDPLVHRRIDAAPSAGSLDRARQPDARWVRCRRPVVKLGGEMTLGMMDLELDPVTRYYKAPAQLRANNGLLFFDDLGRQRVSARQILNRWIVPLDRRVDYLSLHTGTTFQVPFDVMVIFSSNLSPASLDDPAFVRRLGYKIRLGALDERAYRRVFEQACRRAGVPHDEAAADYLIGVLHRESGTPLLAAYPLDLVLKIRDRALYDGVEPRLSAEALRWSWDLYLAAEGGDDGNAGPHPQAAEGTSMTGEMK